MLTIKQAIIEEFEERASIRQHDGGESQEDAESNAAIELVNRHGKWVGTVISKQKKEIQQWNRVNQK